MTAETAVNLTAIGTVGAVLLALGIALFQDDYRKWRRHPDLHVTVSPSPPDCVLIPFWRNVESDIQIGRSFGVGAQAIMQLVEGNSYYFRIKVQNTGKETARNVEVYAKELKVFKDGDWKIVPEFPPMNLIWSNPTPQTTLYLPYLEPTTAKHCDIGYIVDPAIRKKVEEENHKLNLKAEEVSVTFDLVAKPLHMGHVVAPGRYRLEIVIAAEHSAAVTETVELYFNGAWSNIEDEMLSRNVTITVKRI